MSKNVIIALVLIALSVIVMILSRNHAVAVNLVFKEIRPDASLAYLGFTSLGVVIGVLLK